MTHALASLMTFPGLGSVGPALPSPFSSDFLEQDSAGKVAGTASILPLAEEIQSSYLKHAGQDHWVAPGANTTARAPHAVLADLDYDWAAAHEKDLAPFWPLKTDPLMGPLFGVPIVFGTGSSLMEVLATDLNAAHITMIWGYACFISMVPKIYLSMLHISSEGFVKDKNPFGNFMQEWAFSIFTAGMFGINLLSVLIDGVETASHDSQMSSLNGMALLLLTLGLAILQMHRKLVLRTVVNDVLHATTFREPEDIAKLGDFFSWDASIMKATVDQIKEHPEFFAAAWYEAPQETALALQKFSEGYQELSISHRNRKNGKAFTALNAIEALVQAFKDIEGFDAMPVVKETIDKYFFKNRFLRDLFSQGELQGFLGSVLPAMSSHQRLEVVRYLYVDCFYMQGAIKDDEPIHPVQTYQFHGFLTAIWPSLTEEEQQDVFGFFADYPAPNLEAYLRKTLLGQASDVSENSPKNPWVNTTADHKPRTRQLHSVAISNPAAYFAIENLQDKSIDQLARELPVLLSANMLDQHVSEWEVDFEILRTTVKVAQMQETFDLIVRHVIREAGLADSGSAHHKSLVNLLRVLGHVLPKEAVDGPEGRRHSAKVAAE